MQKILLFLKKLTLPNSSKKVRIGYALGVVCVLGIVFNLGGNGGYKPEEITRITKGDMRDIVSITGKVRSASTVDIGFEKAGKIGQVSRAVGEKVSAGDPIVSLSNGELVAALRAEEAALQKLTRGTRSEELSIAESQAVSSKADAESATLTLVTVIKQVYASADDAVLNKADVVFDDPGMINPRFRYEVDSYNDNIAINKQRSSIGEVLSEWASRLPTISATNVDGEALRAGTALSQVKSFLDALSTLVNALQATAGLTQTDLDSYKASIGVARTNLNTALSTLSSARDAWVSATSKSTVSNKEFALKAAGSASEDVAAQAALVDRARAELEKTIIRAPFSGIVTRVDAVSGETKGANERVVTVIDDSKFEVEANIPEVDIGRVVIGNLVKITLDAFPDKAWNGLVTYIEPSETIVDGVVSFKIKVSFEGDSSIKNGLTSNLDIVTYEKSDVVSVPVESIFYENGKPFVYVLDGKKTIPVPIQIGYRGVNGLVEVVQGDISEKVIVLDPKSVRK